MNAQMCLYLLCVSYSLKIFEEKNTLFDVSRFDTNGVFFYFFFTEDHKFVYCPEVLNSQAIDDRGTEVTEKLHLKMLLIWL